MRVDFATLSSALLSHDIVDVSYLATRPFVECFAGVHSVGNVRVFIKVLHSNNPNVRRNFLREEAILQALADLPGLPVLVASSCGPPFCFHACEYISSPSLDAMVGMQTGQTLLSVLQIAGALARWMSSLHQRGYVHRDISPDHVLVTGHQSVTVVDFGMAKPTDNLPQHVIQSYEGYDIQAFGMLLWELICGRSLFSYRSARLPAQLAAEIALIQGADMPAAVARLLTNCLCNPSEFTPTGLWPRTGFGTAAHLDSAVALLGVDEEAEHPSTQILSQIPPTC
jgi:serine/threonine protein kinase